MGRVFLVGHHPGVRAALALAIGDQSGGALEVVGEACQIAGEIATILAAQPTVLVVVLGFETSDEHAAAQALSSLAPGCRVVVIDTREGATEWPNHRWGRADALLHADQLTTELVPTLCRLVA